MPSPQELKEAQAFLRGLLEKSPARRIGTVQPAHPPSMVLPPSPLLRPSRPAPSRMQSPRNLIGEGTLSLDPLDIRAHPFFAKMDWTALENRRLPPPQRLPRADRRVEDVRCVMRSEGRKKVAGAERGSAGMVLPPEGYPCCLRLPFGAYETPSLLLYFPFLPHAATSKRCSRA